MLLLLPFAAFLLFFQIFQRKGLEWRAAFLTAAVFWGVSLTVITELLSVPRLLSRGPVAILWLMVCLAAIPLLLKSPVRAKECSPPGSEIYSWASLNRVTKGLLVGVGLIVLLVAITALVAAPSTWDAMEYHLPRVTFWMSNHDVRFFPTPDYCQLIYSNWAEYAIMHTELLSGDDRFVNLIESFSLLGCIIGVSLIAKFLGAGTRGQIFAALVCATIPEGILEASGPMNTYVVSFWIVATVVFLLQWNREQSWFTTLTVGLAAGLAVLTKGTAYVFLPFIVLACWCMGTSASRVLFFKRSAAFLFPILVLNAPQYIRNWTLSRSPLGVPLPVSYPRIELTMQHVTIRGTLANVLRNLSLHFSTPSEALSLRIERMFRMAIHLLGVNPDDPGSIWLGDSLHFHINHFSLNEVLAGNHLHLLVLLISLGLVFFWRKKLGISVEVLCYAAGLVCAFFLFCALLRWQMWSSRYHLPIFVLGSALVGLVLERYFPRRLATTAAILLLLWALPFVIANRTRSLIPWSRLTHVYHPREVLYFSDGHETEASTNIAAAEAVNRSNCGQVAIDAYVEDPAIKHSPTSLYIYPLLALIHADGRTRTVWYTGVENLSSKYASQHIRPDPCTVICLDCVDVKRKWDQYQRTGGQTSVFGHIVIFSSAGRLENSGVRASTAD